MRNSGLLLQQRFEKSPGPDGIPPYLLAQLPDTTFRKIGDIVRICYAQGDMPTTLEHSQIISL